MSPRRESEIKSAIQTALKAMGVMAFRMNSGRMVINHKGKYRSISMAPSGTADILAFVGKEPLWIEVKRGEENQSREQRIFEILVNNMGHHYLVARDLDSVTRAVMALRGIGQ